MQNHNDAMKTSEHRSLEKYTSHFIWKGCVWEGVGDRTEQQHSDPHSYGHNSFLSRSPRMFNRGLGDPASLGHDPHSSIFSPIATAQSGVWGPPLLGAGSLYRILSPTDLKLWTPTAQSGSWGPPLLGAGSLYSILSPTNSNFLCTELYYYFTPTQFNLSTVKVITLIPSTGCTCYLHRCISYLDSSAGVNIQHFTTNSDPLFCNLTPEN